MTDFRDIPDVLDASPPSGKFAAPPIAPPLPDAPLTVAGVRRRRLAALAAGSAWFVLQLFTFGLRADLGALPTGYLAAVVVAPFVTGALAVFLALHPGRLGLGLRTPAVLALSILAPASFIVAAVVAQPPWPAEEHANLVAELSCLSATLAWTLLPLLGAGLAFRRAFAGGALFRSALVAAGLATVAAALFTLHCPIVGSLHLALGHGGAVVAAALAGGLLLARWTKL